MKLRIVWIGKTKDPEWSALTAGFLQRLKRFVSIEITEIKDPRTGDDRRQIVAEEKRLLEALSGEDRVVALDPEGTLWNSKQLATFVGKHLENDPRRLTFVIGGYSGLTEAIKGRSERLWSLSPLTFTHEMTRVLVAEQLYRALCILKNHPYAK